MSFGTLLKILLVVIANAPDIYKIVMEIINAAKVDEQTKKLVKSLPEEPDAGAIQQSLADYEKGAAEYLSTCDTP